MVRNTQTDQQQVGFPFDCSMSPTSFNFNVPGGTKYKVVVTDCASPENVSNYVRQADGKVFHA